MLFLMGQKKKKTVYIKWTFAEIPHKHLYFPKFQSFLPNSYDEEFLSNSHTKVVIFPFPIIIIIYNIDYNNYN